MGGKLVDAIRALELREGQAAADAVLHVLDLPLVGHDEDQVVPELPQSLVGPLVLEDLLDERREALGVGVDREGVVVEQDEVGPAIAHDVVDLVGPGREWDQVERSARGPEEVPGPLVEFGPEVVGLDLVHLAADDLGQVRLDHEPQQ